jgi:hypothetical protein
MSRAVWKRASASTASALANQASSDGGRDGARSLAGTKRPPAIATQSEPSVSPEKGTAPVSE